LSRRRDSAVNNLYIYWRLSGIALSGQSAERRMIFNELDRTLPNGFHDAELRHFSMDDVNRTLIFDFGGLDRENGGRAGA
jgi:hypothetical protein